MSRKEGYYWIKFHKDYLWVIGEWSEMDGGVWLITGVEGEYTDKDIYDMIEERLKEPTDD